MIEKVLDIYTTPFTIVGRMLFKTRTARIVNLIILLLCFACGIGFTAYAYINIADTALRKEFIESIVPFFALPAGVIIVSYIFYIASETLDKTEIQLEKIREERVEITQKIEQEKAFDIFHTIQLSLNQLNEYYTINKGQAKSSFRFSIFAIILGLLTILLGIWLNYFADAKIELSFIAGISGVLLEFIGGAYFIMYKKSLEQVNFFFGQLIKIQDTMLSINMSNSISDSAKKIEIQEKIIISLLERSLK